MRTKILIGADPFPPYQYIDENGALQGLDYETVRAAFAAAEIDIEVELHDWPIVDAKLKEGYFQAAFQVQPTEERLKLYQFSNLLRNAATELVSSQKELHLSSYSEIPSKNLRLGVLEGYTNGPDIDALPNENKKYYADAAALLQAISKEEVDLGVFDQGVKQYLANSLGISNVYAVKGMTFTRPLHVVFHDKELCSRFNEGLASL